MIGNYCLCVCGKLLCWYTVGLLVLSVECSGMAELAHIHQESKSCQSQSYLHCRKCNFKQFIQIKANLFRKPTSTGTVLK
jgi:hypothetical protein